jgi:hypothetical protein
VVQGQLVKLGILAKVECIKNHLQQEENTMMAVEVKINATELVLNKAKDKNAKDADDIELDLEEGDSDSED